MPVGGGERESAGAPTGAGTIRAAGSGGGAPTMPPAHQSQLLGALHDSTASFIGSAG